MLGETVAVFNTTCQFIYSTFVSGVNPLRYQHYTCLSQEHAPPCVTNATCLSREHVLTYLVSELEKPMPKQKHAISPY